MKGINKSKIEEKGYRKAYKIDLVNNKGEAILVNILGIVIVLVMAVFIPFVSEENIFEFFIEGGVYKSFVFVISLILYIPLHELVHGAVLKAFTNEKLSFGWKFVYAYCGSQDAMVKRGEYMLVALAPLVVFSILFVALMALDPRLALVWYVMEIMNVSGSVGDIYVTIKIGMDRRKDILINDTGTDMTVWERANLS